ncbi:MAG: DISARM system phospholipase D-like protein DrmC [Polyangia bacterium]|jgi:phosphatidylserine/phosphatidylglycerophosphate/cardiolipin synthase-like enzyme|nr:DISARM system phospholipase D-like protein DrmC [Polyangia bacterium]
MKSSLGLAAVAAPDLRALLGLVKASRLPVPITQVGLQSVNLGHLAGRLGRLEGIDRAGVLAVLEVALAEREGAQERTVELVWTGPETRVSTSRDTAVVVRQLFTSARRSVLVAGYAFDHGEEIFRPLHTAMQERNVRVDMFLDLRERAPVGVTSESFAARKMEEFLEENWPFGDPLPRLFYAPATITPDSMASVHAKCVVVDEASTLITSANFTDRGQSRNIEIGVLIHDKQLALQLIGQWKGVLAAGQFVQGR